MGARVIKSILEHPIISAVATILIAWLFAWILTVNTHIAVADERNAGISSSLERIERKVDSINEYLRKQ